MWVTPPLTVGAATDRPNVRLIPVCEAAHARNGRCTSAAPRSWLWPCGVGCLPYPLNSRKRRFRMRKFVVMASLVATTLGAGVGGAFAVSPSHATRVNSATLQAQAASMMHSVRVAAAHWQVAHAQTAKTDANSSHPSCPPTSIGGRNGITQPPCGVDHNNITPKCPPGSPNAGNPPPCGQPSPPPSSPPPAPPCGPSSQGGSPATGPLTGPLYNLGSAINDNGGAPLGDVVQTVACAVFNLTGHAL